MYSRYFKSSPKSVEEFEIRDVLYIREGELNKVYLESTDPKSPDGERITGLEQKKIFEAIKQLEDKILKIKLAINKNPNKDN